MYPRLHNLVGVTILLNLLQANMAKAAERICRGDELVHAVIRTCSGTRSLMDDEAIRVRRPESTTEEQTTVDTTRVRSLVRLEALLDILYVAGELDNDDFETDRSRPKRSAVRSRVDDVPSGSGVDRVGRVARQLDRRSDTRERMTQLMKKCCHQSCTSQDLSQMCPNNRRMQ